MEGETETLTLLFYIKRKANVDSWVVVGLGQSLV